MSEPRILDLAVLISGTGRTLQNFIEHIRERSLPARIKVVLSSSADAKGINFAREADIPYVVVERSEFKGAKAYSRAITKAMEPHQVDLVLLAGFSFLWAFPGKYRNRVLNIHPALLPAFGGKGFYGHHVHEAVIKAGAKESGCTVHICDHQYDHGPTLLQRKIPVLPEDTPDTLAARVFEQECAAYPRVIRDIAEGRIPLGKEGLAPKA